MKCPKCGSEIEISECPCEDGKHIIVAPICCTCKRCVWTRFRINAFQDIEKMRELALELFLKFMKESEEDNGEE